MIGNRVVIVGGPRTGKTTLANSLCPDAKHTDDLMDHEWSKASLLASQWMDEPGPWVIEGVATARAIRKWHANHANHRPPIDHVIYLHQPHIALTQRQEAMAKGVDKVFGEVEAWLIDSKVNVMHIAFTGSTEHPRISEVKKFMESEVWGRRPVRVTSRYVEPMDEHQERSGDMP